MAEVSGFFESEWDDTLLNPLTEELTGWWDRSYFSEQFAKYFALFVGNGVFINPTNQLIVRPGNGMQVIVSKGWAFINGYWYQNTEDKVFDVPLNSMTVNRVDSVRVRWNDTTRKIETLYFSNDTNNVRNGNFYDLKLADITIMPDTISVVASSISDTRPNDDVCGFVRGLMQIETTKDLFAQFKALFNEFMEEMQNIVNNTALYKVLNREFIVVNNSLLTFVDGQCKIEDERITQNSLIDVYFTTDTMDAAEGAMIYVEAYDGYLILFAESEPTNEVKASIKVRVVLGSGKEDIIT